MKKVTLTTILLFLLTSISVLAAQENATNENEVKILNSILEEDAMTSQNEVINVKVIELTDNNNVSVLVKHNIIKSSSRKSRMKNVVNFLKNPEVKNTNKKVLC